jgi:hypothetical protein
MPEKFKIDDSAVILPASEEEAKDYEPPRSRKGQSPDDWARWRLFSMESLTTFLNTSSDAAKAVSEKPTYTCFTNDQTATWSSFRGVNNFDNPRGSMDILGYTIYRRGFHYKKSDIAILCLLLIFLFI